MDEIYSYCTKCKTLFADEGPHEAKHHGKYMKHRFSDPLIKLYNIEGNPVQITPILAKIITQLLQMIQENDSESGTQDGESGKLLPHITAVIKHCLCVINETEYVEEDEEGSASEEDESDDH
jgi:hypothetical protein